MVFPHHRRTPAFCGKWHLIIPASRQTRSKIKTPMGKTLLLFPSAEILFGSMAGILAFKVWGLSPFSVLALTAATLFLIWISRLPLRGRIVLPLAAAAVFWGMWHTAEAFDLPEHIANNVPSKGALTGQVAGGFEYYPGSCQFILYAESLDGKPVRGGVKVSLRNMAGNAPLPGDIIRFTTASLKPVTAMRNIGGYDYTAHMRDSGIGARFSARGEEDFTVIEHGSAWRPGNIGERLRRAMRDFIFRYYPAERIPAVAAMTIGITGFLSRQEKLNYGMTGIAHLFSVSGLHVGFISGIAFVAFNFLFFNFCCLFNRAWAEAGAHRRAAAFGALMVVGLFVFTAGAKVSAVRAGIMAAVFFTAVIIRRESRIPNALAIAALLTLLYDPGALFSISFILSYGAVLTIAAMMACGTDAESEAFGKLIPKKSGWRKRAKLFLLTAQISAAITITLAPVIMTAFNELYGAGIVANIAAIPLGAMAVPSVFAAAFVGYFFPALAPVAAWISSLPYTALDGIASFFAAHPLISFSGAAPTPWLIALFYATLALLLSYRGRIAYLAAAVCIASVVVFYWPVARTNGEFRFIDVGQGDATLILFKEGASVLVDGGPAYGNLDAGELAVLPELRRLGIRKLDAVIATHGDMDHVGGLFTLLRRFPVTAFYDNGGEEKMLGALRSVAAEHGVRTARLSAGDRLAFGGGSIDVLSPTLKFFDAAVERKGNNRSLVLVATMEGKRLLLPGDAEMPVERDLLARRAPVGVDLLHVAHHGSRSSTTPEFTAAAGPKLAVISDGAQNIFHFPARITLKTLADQNIPVLRTDLLGEIVLRPARRGFFLTTWADPSERFIPTE